MHATDDDLFELIGQLDPTRTDPPPAADSVRRRSILDAAMSHTVTAPTPHDEAAGFVSPSRQHRPWRRLAAVAAVVIAAMSTVMLWPSGDGQSAAAAVRSAAEALGRVTFV
jgi:hypothetical protein